MTNDSQDNRNEKPNAIDAYLESINHPITRMNKDEKIAYLENRQRNELSKYVVQTGGQDQIQVTLEGIERYGPQFRQGGINIHSITTLDEFVTAYFHTREFAFSGLYEVAERLHDRAKTPEAKDENEALMDILVGDLDSVNQREDKQKRSELKAQLRVV